MLGMKRSSALPADVQIELITLLFSSLSTVAIIIVPVTAIGVAAQVAWSNRSALAYVLLFATVVAVVLRVIIILSFVSKTRHLTLQAAKRWAGAYGASALAIGAAMGTLTAVAVAGGGITAYAAYGWCIATSLGVTARTATVPWIPVSTATVALFPLAIVAALRPEPEFWIAGGFAVVVFGSVVDCAKNLYSTCVDRLMARREAALMAKTDPLTGLSNRLAFRAALSEACAGGSAFALLYIDLDGFKAVNDALGHSTGDTLLVEVAARLTQVADGALVARLGGDEFGILLAGAGRHAHAVASLVVDQVVLPFHVDGQVVRIGASVGVARGSGIADDPIAIVRQADEALYVAKASGKCQWSERGRNVA